MSPLAVVDTVQVTAIAAEVFSAMVDRQTGPLTSWPGGHVAMASPMNAWVHLATAPTSRVQLTTDAGTAQDLTRAFLRMGAAEPLEEVDVVDAFGEIANVFGGNIKALLPEHVELTLPQVSPQSPSGGALRILEVVLAWRGRPFVISLWRV